MVARLLVHLGPLHARKRSEADCRLQCRPLDHTSCHKVGRVTIGRERCSVAIQVSSRRLTSLMLRLLHVPDAAGVAIAIMDSRARDDTKSSRDLYDEVSAEFELDRPA